MVIEAKLSDSSSFLFIQTFEVRISFFLSLSSYMANILPSIHPSIYPFNLGFSFIALLFFFFLAPPSLSRISFCCWDVCVRACKESDSSDWPPAPAAVAFLPAQYQFHFASDADQLSEQKSQTSSSSSSSQDWRAGLTFLLLLSQFSLSFFFVLLLFIYLSICLFFFLTSPRHLGTKKDVCIKVIQPCISLLDFFPPYNHQSVLFSIFAITDSLFCLLSRTAVKMC